MDCTEKEEILSSSSGEEEVVMEVEVEEGKKFCSDCKTTKTPLWRSGPSGPKSLCNACGIRHRKRRKTAGATPVTTGGDTAAPRSLNFSKKIKIGKPSMTTTPATTSDSDAPTLKNDSKKMKFGKTTITSTRTAATSGDSDDPTSKNDLKKIKFGKMTMTRSSSPTPATNDVNAAPELKNFLKKGKVGKRRKGKLRDRLKVNSMDLGQKRCDVKRVTGEKQWGEVERAALLLMALSCGAVFA